MSLSTMLIVMLVLISLDLIAYLAVLVLALRHPFIKRIVLVIWIMVIVLIISNYLVIVIVADP